MNALKVFEGGFALVNGNQDVIGVVCKYNDTQWQFMPLVKGSGIAVDCIPLRYALAEAMKFEEAK